jgi:hypothetical protein
MRIWGRRALAFRDGPWVLGALLTLFAMFFVVVVVDHVLTLRLRRALLITPERLTVELGGQVVSVGWKEIHVDIFEQVSTPEGITVTNRFLEVTPRRGAPSWSTTRRHRLRLLPNRWRQKVLRIGVWLFDHPERVLATLTSMRRQRDERARQVDVGVPDRRSGCLAVAQRAGSRWATARGRTEAPTPRRDPACLTR